MSPATHKLIDDFAGAVKGKLAEAEQKYGFNDDWRTDDWEADCQRDLASHVAKGDPLDVAAYAAFCWARGYRTAAPPADEPKVTGNAQLLLGYLAGRLRHADGLLSYSLVSVDAAQATMTVERDGTDNAYTITVRQLYGTEWSTGVETSVEGTEQGPDTPILRHLGEISDETRARIRRIMNGEAAQDRIRRGDVHQAIRSLRTNPVPSPEYQRALGDVSKLVAALSSASTAYATDGEAPHG